MSGAGSVEYCGLKLEKGTMPSDWCPAPQDVDQDITAVSGVVSSHTSSISQLQQTDSSISASVSSNTSKINTISGNVSTNTSSISSLSLKADGISATVSSNTDYLMNGDKLNLLGTSAYDGEGWLIDDGDLSREDEEYYYYYTTTSDAYNGRVLKDAQLQIEMNEVGSVSVYSKPISLTNEIFTISCNMILEYANFTLQLIRYTNKTNADRNVSGVTANTILTHTESQSPNYNYRSDRFTFTPSTSAYYRLKWTISTNEQTLDNGDVPWLQLSRVALYRGNIAASDFKPWYTVYSSTQSQISQTATEIKLGLDRAGISLTSGKITSVADNFEWLDNSGNTVMGVDTSTNELTFGGTIKSSNFYHSVCYYMEGGIYADENGEQYAYCANTNADGIYNYGFRVGQYYSLTQLQTMTNHNYDNWPSGFYLCTYKADIINLMPKSSNWSDTTSVKLPSPQHFIGKTVEVLPFAYNTTNKNVYVSCVISTRLANGVYWNGTRLALLGSALDSVTLVTGTRTLFHSVNVNGIAYWIKLYSK
jgi:hypothetical protein